MTEPPAPLPPESGPAPGKQPGAGGAPAPGLLAWADDDLPTLSPADALPSDVLPSDVLPSDMLPSDMLPSDVLPSDMLPSDMLPSDMLPSGALPSDALPSEALPSDALPSEALPSDALPSVPLPASPARRSPDPRRPPGASPGGEEMTIPMLTEIVQVPRYAREELPASLEEVDWAELAERIRENVTERLSRRAQALLDAQLRESLAVIVDRATESLAAELRDAVSRMVGDIVGRAVNEELTRVHAEIARRGNP
jgi:hypothetical protein